MWDYKTPIMKCLFDQWYDGKATNLNKFTIAIFEAYQLASGDNRQRLIKAWPEWFSNSQYL